MLTHTYFFVYWVFFRVVVINCKILVQLSTFLNGFYFPSSSSRFQIQVHKSLHKIMEFSISFSHLLKKSLMENFIFCAVHEAIEGLVTTRRVYCLSF